MGQYGRAYSQTKGWRNVFPPDKSFSIELPTPLVKCASFEGEHGASLVQDQKLAWANCFAGIETTPRNARFGIIVLNREFFEEVRLSRSELIDSIADTLIGDDDESSYMRPPVAIRSKGLAGNEYLFVKNDSSEGFELYTRGRIFDKRNKIYVAVYVGSSEDDLKSSDANRFFNSFRLL